MSHSKNKALMKLRNRLASLQVAIQDEKNNRPSLCTDEAFQIILNRIEQIGDELVAAQDSEDTTLKRTISRSKDVVCGPYEHEGV